jgi:hypothetical protein
VTKLHVNDLISCHVVGCNKLVTNQVIVKLCPKQIPINYYLTLKKKKKNQTYMHLPNFEIETCYLRDSRGEWG